MISNTLCENVIASEYKFSYDRAMAIALAYKMHNLGIISNNRYYSCKERKRRYQSRKLLNKLDNNLKPIPEEYKKWLNKRNIYDTSRIQSLDIDNLKYNELLDLWIYPHDYILDNYQNSPITGPVFEDRRDGILYGICIRNITTNKDHAAAAKYTISNYGWYLEGFDLYDKKDEIFIVEGVFDAIAMRKNGYNAIAIASAIPSAFQLSCIMHKFNNINLCLDNDFWGHVGAYLTSKTCNFNIFMTEQKDPGMYDDDIKIKQVNLPFVVKLLEKEIPQYNRLVRQGKLKRQLPYN